MAVATSVDQYIHDAPAAAQPVLRRLRATIRSAAPDTDESISYGMPFYSYKGEVGVARRLCYFGLQRASVGLFFRPKDLEPHAEQIATYRSSKSSLRFSLNATIPFPLIRKIVRDAVRRHSSGSPR